MAWRVVVAVSLLMPALLAGCSGPRTMADFSFDGQTIGSRPTGLDLQAGEWRITTAADAPSAPNVLAQTQRSSGYNLATWSGAAPADLVAEARVQILSGTTDREAGLAVRVKDTSNHYLFNIDANEGGIRFTRVHDGIRDDLVKDLDVPFQLGTWYDLKVKAEGASFTCWVDGQRVAQVHDATFSSGGVGLWTKKDSTARFDEFSIRA